MFLGIHATLLDRLFYGSTSDVVEQVEPEESETNEKEVTIPSPKCRYNEQLVDRLIGIVSQSVKYGEFSDFYMSTLK